MDSDDEACVEPYMLGWLEQFHSRQAEDATMEDEDGAEVECSMGMDEDQPRRKRGFLDMTYDMIGLALNIKPTKLTRVS
jgi:hypothetical protein